MSTPTKVEFIVALLIQTHRGIFIGAIILTMCVANMAFQQGQANADAKSFFQSDANCR